MGLTLITKPTSEPVTVEETKQHCRIDINDDDALLAGYIISARRWIETQVGPLLSQTWDYTIDRCWPMVGNYYGIRLPFSPVSSVTSVSYVDTDGATQTLSGSLYTTQLDIPVPTIWRAYNQSWPSIRDVPAAITVRFVCGYTSMREVPDPLRMAVMLLTGHLYEHREDVIVPTLPTQIPSQLPMGVEALISPYAIAQRMW